MTDDTGQPTVDRLAALEAALRLMLTHGERCNWFADRGDEEVCDQARAALDAASPLTTPTPDKGALERARRLANRLAKHFIGEQFAAEDETCSRCVAMVTDALTAAEAEARAAAIEECIGTLDGYKQGIIDNEDWPDQDAELVNTLDSAIHMLRALAT